MEDPKNLTLMLEARLDVYKFIDSQYKPMPKKADGSIDEYAKGLGNNDIDALRHAYVSGRYTMEFGEETADILGRLNEFKNFNFGTKEVASENMDLWNNAVGRLYGRKAKTGKELFEFLLKALKARELIIDLKDKRKYKGEKSIKRIPKSFVIKIKETKTGANIEFFDVRKKLLMTKENFISAIKQGNYPGYAVGRLKKYYRGTLGRKIRPLALALLKNKKGQMLLHKAYDSLKKETFYRPLGGGIEFRESGKMPVEREINEELRLKVTAHRLVETFENIFSYESKPGHEIVMLFETEFKDAKNYDCIEIDIVESGKVISKAVWRTVEEIRSEGSKLYPAGIEKLLL